MWEDKKQGATEPLLRRENDAEFGSSYSNDPHFKGMTEEGRKFNDIIFGLLFVAACVGSVAISSVAFSQGDPNRLIPSNEFTNDAEVQSTYWFQDSVARMKGDTDVMGGALALAIVLGFLWIQLLKAFTKLFIYLTLFIGVALVIAVGCYLFVAGTQHQSSELKIVAYCVFVLAALLILAIILLRSKIALTCELYKEACQGIQYNPAIFLVTIIIVAALSLFVIYWTASFLYLYSIPANTKVILPHSPPQFEQGPRNLMYYQVFMFFWVTSFLSAVFQVSTAGGVATWYFSRDMNGPQSIGSPTLRSFGRSLTKSFGSLALGSLILAVVQFINFILRVVKKKNQIKNPIFSFIISCVQCIFGCVQRIVKFLNRYAYIYIAMHGDGFCSSAKNCFNLISRNFFSAAIVDLLGEFVLFVGKLLGTAACTIFTLGIVQTLGRQLSGVTIGMVAAVAFAIFSIFAHVVGVSVDTVMVCYLEDLERNKDGALYISPDLHKMLQQKADKTQVEERREPRN